MKLEIVIEGKPVPQERPFFVRGKGTFDRAKSKNEKKRIGMLALIAMRAQGWKKTISQVKVRCYFFGAHGGCDIDNLSKLILDSLTGIVWGDDRQVCELFAIKSKIEAGKEHTKITIEEM